MYTLHIKNIGLWLGIITIISFMGACDLTVNAPALIEDIDLDNDFAIVPLVNGAHADFAHATGGAGGGIFLASAVLTDEFVSAGRYMDYSDGIIHRHDTWNDMFWRHNSKARWIAEDGLRRVTRILERGDVEEGKGKAAIAELSLYAGLANRVLGDHFDFAVIDGGPAEDITVFYERALGHFERAVELAGIGNEVGIAALGGKVQTLIMLGRWSEAMAISGDIPTQFRFEQVHSGVTVREWNQVFWWSAQSAFGGSSVWGTPFESLGLNLSQIDVDDENNVIIPPGDARALYQEWGIGGDNRRPWYRQRKYLGTGSNIAVVKGSEMRLLEAEYALRNNDITGMVELLNEVRLNFNDNVLPDVINTVDSRLQNYELAMIDPEDVTADNAWQLLMEESGLELWIEGRRIAHLRRWQNDPGEEYVRFEVIRQRGLGGAETDPFVSVYDVTPALYLMVGLEEINSNPNLP